LSREGMWDSLHFERLSKVLAKIRDTQKGQRDTSGQGLRSMIPKATTDFLRRNGFDYPGFTDKELTDKELRKYLKRLKTKNVKKVSRTYNK